MNTKKKNRLFSKAFSKKDFNDSSFETFYIDNSIKNDRIACVELSFFLLLPLLILINNIFKFDEYIIRSDENSQILLIINITILVATIVIGIIKNKKNTSWYKYLVSISAGITCFFSATVTVSPFIPLVLFPIFFSVFYYNVFYTTFTFFVLYFLRIAGSQLYNIIYSHIDYKVDYLIGMDIKHAIDITNSIMIFLIGIACIILTAKLKIFLNDKFHEGQEKAVMERDMLTAKNIQSSMLIKDFPDNPEYEVYACTKPAKLVGGDYYNYIQIDNENVVLIISDVSGKGLQASLFMGYIAALTDVYALAGNSTDKIIEKTNNYLMYYGNPSRLFVTAWIGIINLKTGMLSFTNAGHNPPCIRKKNGKYEFLDSKVNFIVGGKPMIRYSENQTMLEPGDRLFLYTDGVTEAKNINGDFYTSDAMLSQLNLYADKSPVDTIKSMQSVLDEYCVNAEQYDDITMLSFLFKAYATEKEKKAKTFPADREHFDEALQFILEECSLTGCQGKIIRDIEISASEIIANICSYAYKDKKGDFEISILTNDKRVIISFTDFGVPFNPLSIDAPDNTVSMRERKAGGLGLHIVKKLMNDVQYQYKNNKNILTISKLFK